MKSWKSVLVAGIATTVLAGGAAAYAQQDGPRRHRAARATVHADSIVVERDGTAHNVVMDLGRITAVDAQRKAFQLVRRDKVEVTVRVSDDTKIREGGQPAQFTDIGVGDRVRTFAEKIGADLQWKLVRLLPQESAEAQAAA